MRPTVVLLEKNVKTQRERTTKMSSRSLTNVHLTAYPSFSYFSSVVRPSMSASRIRELTGDDADAASCAASGVKERDHKTIPPDTKLGGTPVQKKGTHPCEILSSGPTWWNR